MTIEAARAAAATRANDVGGSAAPAKPDGPQTGPAATSRTSSSRVPSSLTAQVLGNPCPTWGASAASLAGARRRAGEPSNVRRTGSCTSAFTPRVPERTRRLSGCAPRSRPPPPAETASRRTLQTQVSACSASEACTSGAAPIRWISVLRNPGNCVMNCRRISESDAKSINAVSTAFDQRSPHLRRRARRRP